MLQVGGQFTVTTMVSDAERRRIEEREKKAALFGGVRIHLLLPFNTLIFNSFVSYSKLNKTHGTGSGAVFGCGGTLQSGGKEKQYLRPLFNNLC